MALPGVPQTFAVEGARDLTDKLWSNIEAYRLEQHLQPKLWLAFDCAVTGWHVSDWLWRERTAAGRETRKIQQFQDDMQARHYALRICKYLATASKHSGVDYKQDSTIQVIVQAKPPSEEQLALAEIDDDLGDNARDWEIIVTDVNGGYDALGIFYEVQKFWDDQIRDDEHLADPERFNPSPLFDPEVD